MLLRAGFASRRRPRRIAAAEWPTVSPAPVRRQPGHAADADAAIHHGRQLRMTFGGNALRQGLIGGATLAARATTPINAIVHLAAITVIAIGKPGAAIGGEWFGKIIRREGSLRMRCATAGAQHHRCEQQAFSTSNGVRHEHSVEAWQRGQ